MLKWYPCLYAVGMRALNNSEPSELISSVCQSMMRADTVLSLRGEMNQMEIRILKWFVTTAFAMTTMMAAASVATAKLFR